MCIFNRIVIRRTLNMPSKVANHSIMITFKTTILKLQLGVLFPIKIYFKFKINNKKLRKNICCDFKIGQAMIAPLCSHFVISERDICCDHCLSSECTVTLKNIITTIGFFPQLNLENCFINQIMNAGVYVLNLSNMFSETFRLASTRARYLKEN